MLHIIPNYLELDKWVELSKKYNASFEYNDFFKPELLDDKDRLSEIIGTYKALNRNNRVDTLHGVFYDMVLNSNDPKIRKLTQNRFRKCISIAEELGCRAVIFHTNYITAFKSKSYRMNWVKDNADFYRKLLRKHPDISIYVENMFDESPELLKALALEMKDERNFGICFDISHAYLSETDLKVWIEELYPFIRHIHLNDNNKDEDSHLAIGDGSLPWEILSDNRLFINSPSVLIEVKDEVKLIKSIEFLKSHNLMVGGLNV